MSNETVVPAVSPTASTPTASNLPAVVPPAPNRSPVSFDADDPVALYMDSGVFGQLQRVAKLMSSSGLVPGYLQGETKAADCFLVAAQAFRWRMDPFAVAQHTFVLKGKLGYEGKLIAAVVNSNRRIEERLKYTYSGTGAAREVIVSGKIRGESEARTVTGKVENWATDNEQWKKDPDQMLAYRGARQWARRHMPEAMIGIQAEEEVRETLNMERTAADGFVVEPAVPALEALTEKLKAQAAAAAAPAASPKVDPKDCKHESVPPSKVAALAPGHSIACPDCDAQLRPDRVPGEDDEEPEPAAKPRARQGRLSE